MGNNYLIIALVFFPFAAGIVSYIIGRFIKLHEICFIFCSGIGIGRRRMFIRHSRFCRLLRLGRICLIGGYTLKLTDSV